MKNLKLICTLCGKDHSRDRLALRCSDCNEPLEFEEVREGRIHIESEPGQNLFERYADFLPFEYSDPDSSLGEGFTSLIESRALAEEIGVMQLYLKNETQNPTWSFKDRGTASCIRHALELGYTRVGTVSAGNMGASVAAYGARSRLETFVIADDVAEARLAPIAMYGPHLIRVACGREELVQHTLAIGARRDIYFSNSDAPMRIEGYKTIAYEICEQTSFNVPDVVLMPTSSGGGIRGVEKGFREFYRLGVIDRMPRCVAVQPQACCPIHTAYVQGRPTWERCETPTTIAPDIASQTPYSGNQVLRMLRAGNGLSVAVSDDEMLEAQLSLGKAGMFVQPESAATYAALRHLKQQKEICPDSRVVCILTSCGLRNPSALPRQRLNSIRTQPGKLETHIAAIIKQGYSYGALL